MNYAKGQNKVIIKIRIEFNSEIYTFIERSKTSLTHNFLWLLCAAGFIFWIAYSIERYMF